MSTAIAKPAALKTKLNGFACYVACLASYNSGILHGFWIDLLEVEDIEELKECFRYILQTSPEPGAEELAVHDWQDAGPFSGEDYPDWEDVLEFSEEMESAELDGNTQAFLMFCAGESSGDYRPDYLDFLEAFRGYHETAEDFCQSEFYDNADKETLEIHTRWPFDCIDWERAWREKEQDHWISDWIDGKGRAVFCS